MWITIKNKLDLPICYKSGNWDGLNSDLVVVKDKQNNLYLAYLNSGFIDGSEFSDWIDNHGNILNTEIVEYFEIPL